MLLRSGRMTNSRISQRNYNNNKNNATNIANNIVSQSEQSKPIPSTANNAEVVMAITKPNNDIIATVGKDVMCSQIQTFVVETTLPQTNVITNTNIPPFSTTRPWGICDINIPQLSQPIHQSQLVMSPIMVSSRTNRHSKFGINSHGYRAKQLRNIGVPTENRIASDRSMILMGVSNETLVVFKQQIEHSNH